MEAIGTIATVLICAALFEAVVTSLIQWSDGRGGERFIKKLDEECKLTEERDSYDK